MIDPELKSELDAINRNLDAIRKKSGRGVVRAFFSGMFSALGYVIGLVLVVLILGWTLQRAGLLAPLENQVKNFADLVNSAKKLLPDSGPGSSQSATQKPQSPPSNSQSVITLPNGQKIEVNVPGF